MLVFVGLVVFLVTWCFLRVRHVLSKVPPGPTPLPLIGNLWMLGVKIDFEHLIQLSKTYGNVYTLWMGHTPIMVVNGFHAVKEALVHHADEFSDRPAIPFYLDLWHSKGIMLANGLSWKQQRRFALMTLRNMGLGKKGLEQPIQAEAQHLVDFFAAKKGNALDPLSTINTCIANVISGVVFGHCFSIEDVRFHQLLNASNTIAYFHGTIWGRLYDSLPWLMRCLPGPHQDVFQQYRHLKAFIKEEIEIHRENWSPGEPRDLIDFYLDKLSKVTNEPNTTFNEENMIQVVFDLFMAGSETTSSTLAWALLYMLVNPDIQDRVQEELDEVVGRNNPTKYEDRSRLHYTNAVVHEIQRYANLVPGSLLHACSRDTTFMGLPVPKGTAIYANIGSVLYDPEHWETPRKFNPGHFLDKEGHFVTKEAFLSFGVGPRICVGEILARMEFFIFFTSLLQNFNLRLPEGVTSVNTEPIPGSMQHPHPFMICAVAR